MSKLLTVLFAYFTAVTSFAQSAPTKSAIIPEPVLVITKNGVFTLPSSFTITAENTSENTAAVEPVTNYLKNKLSAATGAIITVSHQPARTTPTTIQLSLYTPANAELGKEGYHLWVGTHKILIKANAAAGLFYGAQTLIQLFPKEMESNALVRNVSWTIPRTEIKDYPRFPWRGLLFDVARHFFTKDEVKQFIDQMARYKFNLLHLHLTDDEGWRVEIKSLPRLTTVGAYNVKKVGEFGSFTPPKASDPKTYGEFYTQDDIRELVKYAQDRFVNIMPEIDVPGHSLAAVVSYPELSCTPGADQYQVESGEPMTADNTLDPSNEKTYAFLDQVITEVSQLFPFEYLHLGGDECSKFFWKKSANVTALMKRQGLQTYEEVQGYFEKRVEKIVEAKGKKFMGWDEIIEGGLGPNAAVMSWRGEQGGITAAKAGHPVVMTPTEFSYLDYMQSDAVNEVHVYNSLRLNKTYEFEPLPDGVDPAMIRGGQANLWTEQIFNFRQVEYMIWPRAFAISESVWSPKTKKDWDKFSSKVEKQFERLDEGDIKYATSLYSPIFDAKLTADHQLQITLTTEVDGLDLYYSFDNSFPDRFYPKYSAPIIAPEDATQIRVISYRGKQAVGRITTMPVGQLRRRIAREAKE